MGLILKRKQPLKRYYPMQHIHFFLIIFFVSALLALYSSELIKSLKDKTTMKRLTVALSMLSGLSFFTACYLAIQTIYL